jgi:DNA ligase-1
MFPELHHLDIPDGRVLDGEIIVTDTQGKPDFEAMMEKFQSRRSEHKIQYCVFDMIYFKGEKLTLSLIKRKELLDSVLKQTETIVKVQWMYGHAKAYF